jgi:2-alkenal reductase
VDLPAGIIVAEVVPGSAAERAGLRGIDRGSGRLGDIITHVNGERVRTVAELAAALTAAGIANTAELTVIHDGRSRTVIVQVVDIG